MSVNVISIFAAWYRGLSPLTLDPFATSDSPYWGVSSQGSLQPPVLGVVTYPIKSYPEVEAILTFLQGWALCERGRGM